MSSTGTNAVVRGGLGRAARAPHGIATAALAVALVLLAGFVTPALGRSAPTIANSAPRSAPQELVGVLAAGSIVAELTISPEDGYITLGQMVTINTTVYFGGTPPYTFSYSGLPPGCVGGDVPQFTCTPTVAGTSNVAVLVTDTAGDSGTATGIIDAVAPSGHSSSNSSVTTSTAGAPNLDVVGAILFLFFILLAGAAWQAFGSSGAETPPDAPRPPAP
jgi:hypothetical protein